MRELPQYGLIVPSRPHAVRMFVETQLANAGGRMNVAWEVDGIPAILDLVARGHDHAVLTINSIRNHPIRLSLGFPACRRRRYVEFILGRTRGIRILLRARGVI